MSGVLHGGETILLTTHYLDDVEQFLDRVLVLHDGVIADDFLMEDLQQSGETLLARLGRTCGWDPARYLQFGRGGGVNHAPPDPQRGRPLAAFAGAPRPGRAPRRAAGGRRLAGRRPAPARWMCTSSTCAASSAPPPASRPCSRSATAWWADKTEKKKPAPAALGMAAGAGFLKHVCRPGETGAGPVEKLQPASRRNLCRGRCSHRPAAPAGQPTSPGNRNFPRARGCASHAALPAHALEHAQDIRVGQLDAPAGQAVQAVSFGDAPKRQPLRAQRLRPLTPLRSFILRLPYLISPSTGWPRYARCARIWCVRPGDKPDAAQRKRPLAPQHGHIGDDLLVPFAFARVDADLVALLAVLQPGDVPPGGAARPP